MAQSIDAARPLTSAVRAAHEPTMFDQPIRFAARTRPLALALTNGQTHVTYRQLDEGVDQVAAALTRSGVGPAAGSDEALVGVSVRDAYQHALVTLAAARLGLATTSLFPTMAAGMAALAGVTHLVADDAALSPAVLADAGWFDAARAAPAQPLARVRLNPAAVGRVQLSSGTTGLPKAVGLSWSLMTTRQGLAPALFGIAARTVSMIGVESGGMSVWLATWRSFGCVVVPPANPAALAAALPILQPTTIVASPVQIAALADALDRDPVATAQAVLITVAGGRVSRTVRERLALSLGAVVVPAYASTEAGTVATAVSVRLPDDGDVGYLMPGVAVEIVTDDGLVLPVGETGHVRIAGPGVVAGYRDRQPTPAFRDGWFYPGDLGSLSAEGLLRIAGRADEVLNIGGEKVAPEALEELVRPVAGVADVAAFSLPGDAGDQPWLAIVRAGEVDEGAVGRALTLPGLGTVRIAWIEAIPRTLMGKVRREELQAAARKL